MRKHSAAAPFPGIARALACEFRRLVEVLLLFNQGRVVREAPTKTRAARALIKFLSQHVTQITSLYRSPDTITRQIDS
jgi:hypothetical protein